MNPPDKNTLAETFRIFFFPFQYFQTISKIKKERCDETGRKDKPDRSVL
jgi:hypothetical protein